MNKLFQAALVVLMLVPSWGHAATEGTMSAGDLLTACTTPSESWISFCNGYMQAAFDFAAIEGIACYEPELTRTDLTVLFERNAFTASARNGGSMENISGLTLAVAIFSEHLPCD